MIFFSQSDGFHEIPTCHGAYTIYFRNLSNFETFYDILEKHVTEIAFLQLQLLLL